MRPTAPGLVIQIVSAAGTPMRTIDPAPMPLIEARPVVERERVLPIDNQV